ncbi:MAG: hypothetical protein K0S31_2347 [Sphingobacterium multivorum]|jgi:transcriptional regulator with XRE-family HTH domain|nr:hypothetical protein [Sphingobacterium multivorum]
MEFTIGQRIKEILTEKGVTQTSFADKIGMSRRNLERFFKNKDISIRQLVDASEILDYDFVSEYLQNNGTNYGQNLMQEPVVMYERSLPQNKNEITVQLTIKGDVTLVSKYFPEILSKLKRETDNYGLTIA